MLFFKGIIIGIGKIIPGVSGSMLAISMGVYQKMVDSINNFFKNPKRNFLFLFKIGLGVLVSIIFLSNIILFCLNKYYIITIFFFIGLIIGSFNEIKVQMNNRNNKIVFITVLIMFLISLININKEINIENSFVNFLYFIFVGIVDAVTMVIPGISGTATLMMIGAYDKLMLAFSNLLNFSLFIENLSIMFPFLIGMFIGIIITVKLVSYLFKYHKDNTYSAIIGFSIVTIAIMGIKCLNSNYSFLNLLFSIILLYLGFYISKKINHSISGD